MRSGHAVCWAEECLSQVELSAVMVYTFVLLFLPHFHIYVLNTCKDTTQGILFYEDIQGPAQYWMARISIAELILINIQAMIACKRIDTSKK